MRRLPLPLMPLLAAAALSLAFPPAAAQVPAEVVFTVSVTDSDTTPLASGSHDILEVALGEPGDGTVVLRGTMAEPPGDVDGVLYFGFTAPAGDVVGGCTFAAAPDTRNIGEPIAPDACFVDGAVFYATYSYGSIEAAAGGSLTQIWAFTDVCAAGCLPADTAPGNLAEDWPASAFGTDYPLAGCTRTAGCPLSGPSVTYANLTSPELRQSFTAATNGTYVFNFTSEVEDANLTIAAAGNGTVHVVARNATAEVFNGTLELPANVTQRVTPANGTWQYEVRYQGFNGSLHIDLEPYVAPGPTSTSATSTSNNDNATGTFPLREADKGVPGAGVPMALLATALAAIAVRRRLP